MRLVVAIFLLWSAVPAVAAEPGAEPHVLQVRVVTDEADAALAILEEHARTGAVEPGSWDRLWKSEGFVRLKKRQESFGAKDVEQGFRDFLTSAEPLSRVRELRQALETWKHLDAAAGGPDVHPHATDDDPATWLVWERDVASFNTDLRRLEAFFRDLLAGRLTGEEANKRLFAFIDAEGVPQGAFYTVGWKMAAMVERARGRDALVKLLCDPRQLLAAYNELAAAHPRSDGEGLATWSPDFLAGLTPAAP